MAGPTWQATGAPAAVGIATGSPTWPTHQTDDVAWLRVETQAADAAVLSTPSGFAEVGSAVISPQDSTGTALTSTRLTLFWCRATSSAMAAPVIAATSNHSYSVIDTVRGAKTTGDPWDVGAGTAKTTASTTTTWPAVTSTLADTLLMFFGATGVDTATPQWSSPSSTTGLTLTERFNGATTMQNGGCLVLYTAPLATAGASGTTTATLATSFRDATITLAIAPPSGAVTYHGTATGGVDLAGAASGHAIDHATSTGGLNVAGTATGHALDHGAATGGIALAGAASGHAIDHAIASGGLDLAGFAAGHVITAPVTYHGTASGGIDLAGFASGHVVAHGTASGGLNLAGVAAGHVPASATPRNITVTSALVPSPWTSALVPARWSTTLEAS